MQWILSCILLSLCINLVSAQEILIPYRKGRLWGYANENGTVVVQPKYLRTNFFLDEKYKVVYKEENSKITCGLIKANGQEIVAPNYKSLVKIISETYQKNNFRGVFEDETYQQYASRSYHQNILLVNFFIGAIDNGEEHLIDSTGKIILNKVNNISLLNKYGQGFFSVLFQKNNKYGVANFNGKIILQPKYESLIYLYGNNGVDYLLAQIGSQKALIHMNGKIIIPFTEQEISINEIFHQKNPLFIVTRKENNALFDHTGKKLTRFTNKNISIEIVKINGQEKLIPRFSENNGIAVPDEAIMQGPYDQLENKSYPPAESKDEWRYTTTRILNNKPLQVYNKNGLFGLMHMNDSGIVIEPVYEELNWCLDGYQQNYNTKGMDLLFAKRNKNFGIINAEGKLIIPLQYSLLNIIRYRSTAFNKKLYFIAVKKDGSFGVLNQENKTVIPFNYQFIMSDHYGREDSVFYFYVKNKSGKLGIIRNDKKVQIPEENTVLNQLFIDIPKETTRYFISKPEGKYYGLINLENQEILAPVYDSIKTPFYLKQKSKSYSDIIFNNYCFPVKFQNKFGLIKTDGTYLIPPAYDDIFQLLNPFLNEEEYFFTTFIKTSQTKINFALYSSKKGILVDYDQGLEFKPSELNDFDNGVFLTSAIETNLKGLFFSKTKMQIPAVYSLIRISYDMKKYEKNKSNGIIYFSLYKNDHHGRSYEDLITNKGVKFFED